MRQNIFYSVFISLVFCSFSAEAAISNKSLLGNGFVTGGEATSGVTLTALKKIKIAEKGIERYALEFGDRQGKPLIGKPGYFHVQLKDQPSSSLVINVAKVVGSNIGKNNVEQLIRNSRFLSEADILQNAEDGSQIFTFRLKAKTPVRVYQLKSKVGASKMILELGVRK